MTSNDIRLSNSLQMDLRGKDISPRAKPFLRQSNHLRILPKTIKEANKLSHSQELTPLEPISGLPSKFQTKKVLPSLIVEKPTLHIRQKGQKEQKEPKTTINKMTLDKVLGAEFKPIPMKDIKDFSAELFPSKPNLAVSKKIRSSTEDFDSEKENNRYHANKSLYSSKLRTTTFLDNEMSFESIPDGMHSPSLQENKSLRKEAKLHVHTTNKSLFWEASFDEEEDDSPFFPIYTKSSMNNISMSRARLLKEFDELRDTPETKKSGNTNENEISIEKTIVKPKAVPGAMTVEQLHDFYHTNESFNLPRIHSNKDVTPIHQIHHQKNKETHLPSLGFRRSIKGVEHQDKLKGVKVHSEQNLVEHKILYDDQALFEKYGPKFSLKCIKIVRQPVKQSGCAFVSSLSGRPGRSVRNSTPIQPFHNPVNSLTTNRSVVQN